MSLPIPDHPLISVVLPVYNRAAYVQETIQSLLSQTYPKLEVIAVVDGGSTDHSADIVRSLAARDRRLRPLFTEHLNQWQARNRAIDAARGELLAHMDDDDIAVPHRFATQLEWMRAHELDVCGALTKWFGERESIMWFPETHPAIRIELLFRIAILLPTVMMRTELARTYRLDEELITYSDYQQFTRLAPHFRMGNVPAILLRERAHAGQLHKREAAAMTRDSRMIREQYFSSLFLNASETERTRFRHIVHQHPLKSKAELRDVGEWFVELAQIPEAFFQQCMAMRWRGLCRRSAPLGMTSYRLYQTLLPKIQTDADTNDRALRLACALRLPADSPLAKLAAQGRRALWRKRA